MKKALLTTTALASLVGLVGLSSAQASEAPQIKFNGHGAFNSHFQRQSQRSENVGNGHGVRYAFQSSRFNIEAFGRADDCKDLQYRILFGLTADTNEGNTIKEAMVEFKGDWGTVRFGDTRGPEDIMAQGASRVMGATGGFGGKYKNGLNVSSGVNISTDMTGTSKSATKSLYVTPRLAGFQLGVGYTPNTQKKNVDRNSWSGMINYKNTLTNGVTLAASVGGITGETRSSIKSKVASSRENINSWQVGGVVGYHGLEFGAEYVDNGKSLIEKTFVTENDAGYSASFALGYTLGIHKVAAGYYHSVTNLGHLKGALGGISVDQELGAASANVYSLTYDHKLAPGLGIYAEANYFDLRTSKDAADLQDALKAQDPDVHPLRGVKSNCGHAIIIGTKVKF